MIVNHKWDSTNDETNKLNYLFENSSLLPSDLIDYPNQIGGHGLLFGNKCKILYSHIQSRIYKPIQHYPKGPHELDFYQRLFNPHCHDSILMELRKFVPNFYGVYRDSERKHLYLGLKDLLAHFKHPSLCDLKMGRRTYAPDSSPSKIMIECAKYKWREEIGFLVTGLKVYHPDLNEHTTFDIFFGRSLTPSTIYDHGIRLFLGSNQPRANRLAKQFVRKLSQLAHWFENQSTYHFYASSLLLAYDTVALNSSPPTPAYHQQQPLKHSHCINNCTQLDEPSQPFTTSSSSSVAVNAVDNMATSYNNNNETTATVTSSLSSGDEEQDIHEEDHVLVYLIDFTRWELMSNSNKMKDENFLYGLNYLISLFKRASVESTTTTTTNTITTTTID